MSDQPPKSDQPVFFIRNAQPTYFTLYGGSEKGELVKINMETGEHTFGPHYTPEFTAEVFWSSVCAEYREFLAWKRERGK